MLSSASTPSRFSSVHYSPFTVNVHIQEYRDYLNMQVIGTMPWNSYAELFTMLAMDLIGAQPSVRAHPGWLTKTGIERSCGTTKFDMPTHHLYPTKKNTFLCRY